MEGYDVIFIFPKLWEKEYSPPNQPPYGVLMCADKLMQNGYKVLVYDQRLESLGKVSNQRVINAIKNSSPLYFGISSQSGPMIEYGLEWSKLFHEQCPSTPVAWGGVHPTLMPDQTISHPQVDVVIKGEGELPSFELAEALKHNKPLEEVNGIYWKDKNKAVHINPPAKVVDNLDDVHVRWELVNVNDYIQERDGKKWLGIISSRGCPFRCNFCYNISFYGKSKFRGWSPERTINEIKMLNEWGVDYINFDDDYIPGDLSRFWKILDLRRENKMDFEWRAPIRGHLLRDQLTKKISENGCEYVTIGAESGSPKILKKMDKDSGVSAYYIAAKNLKKYNVRAQFSWILGYPGETMEDAYLTVKTIKDIETINPNTEHILNIFAPYPGTPSYDYAVEYGFVPPSNLEGWSSNFREQCNELKYVENKELLEAIRWVGIFRSMAKTSRYYANWAKPVAKILGLISSIRWKYDFYKMPIEHEAVKLGRKALKTVMNRRIKIVQASDDDIY